MLDLHHFPVKSQYHPKYVFGIRRVWDHQLMGPAGAFMTLWSHVGVGHGPNSGVVSNLEGDIPSHLISTLVYRNTYQLYLLPWTCPLLHQNVVSQQIDGLVHGPSRQVVLICLSISMSSIMVYVDRWSHLHL